MFLRLKLMSWLGGVLERSGSINANEPKGVYVMAKKGMMKQSKDNVIKISIGDGRDGSFIYFVRSRYLENSPKPVAAHDIASVLYRLSKKILKAKRND